jgi:endonuclease YncB( thermonuclease family)
MTHDFKAFPELAGEDLDLYTWQSPHIQLFEDFTALVVKVHDGDTITVRIPERSFDFPIRFNNSAAPELSEKGGHASRDWLKSKLEGEMVELLIDRDNRVEKWGRLLGQVNHMGIDMGFASAMAGHSVPWVQRNDMVFPKWDVDFEVES